MSDVTFTDTITVRVLDSDIAEDNLLYATARFEVTAPISVWLDHGDPGFEYEEHGDPEEPLFYLPGPEPSLDGPQRYLIRGTLETLAEKGWEAYTALLDAGVSADLARSALPSHFMATRIVTGSPLTLCRFVGRHGRYTPGSEVAVVASGYAAHLAETAPQFLRRNH